MARFGSRGFVFQVSSTLLVLVLSSSVYSGPLLGQATEPDALRSPWEPRPQPAVSIPPVNGNAPGPNVRPTPEQTLNFINRDANLRTLDPGLKQGLAYNQGNTWFNSPILPNGQPNTF
jgi:hypothetical protein